MSEWLQIIMKRKIYFDKGNLHLNYEVREQVAAELEVKQEDIKSIIMCPQCNKQLNNTELNKNNKVCSHCNYHFRMNCMERLNMIFDSESIELFDENLVSCNSINFPNYDEKLEKLKEKLEIKEAVITGRGNVLDNEIYFGIMDYRFIMGSMGAAVGEKLTRMIERATKRNKNIIIFSSSGGARMQEGMISLYQMAKVVAAIQKHSEKGLLYISVLTDPTTGGVLASFASIGDIIIAEPNATIGFAGKRVIKNTLKEKISDNFQSSQFHLKNGHIDIICNRENLKKTLSDIIKLYSKKVHDKKIYSKKCEQIYRDNIYENVKPYISSWEKVKLARHPNRPNFKDYIDNIFDNFIELHGDRISNDDQAIVTGIGYIDNIPVTVILSAKGKNLDENIVRNFGMARPEGYRKVTRISKLSEKFGLPIICFIDTPGAHCGIEAEIHGQGEAIANSIKNFTRLNVPIISIITGEGGSGGALATGVADWIFIMENSIYSVISPEGCSSILFKDPTKFNEVSEYLKLTADELIKLKIVDEIIPEAIGDSNIDTRLLYDYMRVKIYNKLIDLMTINSDTLLKLRYDKFRDQGIFLEL